MDNDKVIAPHSRAQDLKPLLAPSEIVGIDIDVSTLHFPIYASIKFNGIRGLLMNGSFISRSGLPLNIHNTILYELQPLVNFCADNKLVLDGEFHAYSDNTTGGMLSMLAGNKKLPYDFKYKVFGIYTYRQWNGADTIFMKDMQESPYWEILSNTPPISQLELVIQELIENASELDDLVFKVQQNSLIEGVMLASPSLLMGHGRQPVRAGKFLKMKFYSDPIDGQIQNIYARQEHLPETETEYDINDRARRSRRQEDMYVTNIGGCLEVKLEGGLIVNIPFPKGTSLQMRTLYLKNFRKGGSFDLYGKWLQFRKLNAGEKDKPNSVKCVEFRDSKGNIL